MLWLLVVVACIIDINWSAGVLGIQESEVFLVSIDTCKVFWCHNTGIF